MKTLLAIVIAVGLSSCPATTNASKLPAPARNASAGLPPPPPPPPPPPAPPADESAYTQPECEYCEQPVYPRELNFARVGGTVKLLIGFDASGSVIDVTINQSSRNRQLDRAALEQARSWHLQPGTVAGVPVGGRVIVPVKFTPLEAHSPTVYEGVQRIPLAAAAVRPPLLRTAAAGDEAITSIAQAVDFLKKACFHAVAENNSFDLMIDNYGEGGASVWTFFDRPSQLGPSVVRRRYAVDDDGPVLKTAYVCEADARTCQRLRDYLDGGYSRPVDLPIPQQKEVWPADCDSR